MKKFLILVLLFIINITACYAASNKLYSINYNGYKYFLLYASKDNEHGGFINEYFRAGQTYHNWSEMVAVHHFPNAYSPIDQIKSFKEYLDSTGLFEYVLGHDNAAGCSIANKDLALFHQKANKDLNEYNFGEDYYEVEFARQALAKDLPDLINDLAQYKNVWSQQCNEPLIYIKDFHFTMDDVQIMGRNKDTIKIVKEGIAYMKFFAKSLIQELQQYDHVKMEIVGKANLNEWMGKVTPQIFIENYEIKEDKLSDF